MAHGESERVTTWLRDAILDGARPPGSRLIERDLAAECGVSRVPVRDALKALENEGLVVLRPNTWAVVREFTEADVRHLDEIRQALEPLVFRRVAELHDPAAVARLHDLVDRERQAAESGDAVRARRLAADFHELASHLAANPLLETMMRTIGSQLRWALSQHDDLVHVAADHGQLMRAIAEADADRAEQLAAEHATLGARWRAARHHPAQ